MKSIVELSLTALRLLLVLKCLIGLPVSLVSGTGILAVVGVRGAFAPRRGLSDVSSDEKGAGPVIDSARV